MSLVGKLFGRSSSQTLEPSSSKEGGELRTLAEIQAFDSQLTSDSDIPYYPLSQVIKNMALREAGAAKIVAEEPAKQIAVESSSDKESRYINEEPIGEGGTAVVYRAIDSRLNRPVALKRFKEESDADYLAELGSASRVRHPNVVSTLDANEDAAGRFIVMELIDGQDAEVAISEGGTPFDLNQFTNFAVQSLEGLHATHQGGLLHLDLKPSNIMVAGNVSGHSIIKLVDFGRAMLLTDEHGNPPKGQGMVGSIYYSAPEQLLEQDLDVRTDLYAIGCVFYWVLTGKRPFSGEGTVQVMAAHLSHIVRPIHEVEPALPQWLADWIMSLMAYEMNDRPNTVKEAIESLVNGEQKQKVRRIDA